MTNSRNAVCSGHRSVMRLGPVLIASLSLLAGCVAPPAARQAAQPSVPAATRPAAANPSALQARTLTDAPAAVTPVAVAPATPSYSGAVDGRTGLRQSAVVAVTGDAASGYTVLFRPARTEATSVEAAPARLCGGSGVASSRTNAPGAASAMPGVQIMIVKCGAA